MEKKKILVKDLSQPPISKDFYLFVDPACSIQDVKKGIAGFSNVHWSEIRVLLPNRNSSYAFDPVIGSNSYLSNIARARNCFSSWQENGVETVLEFIFVPKAASQGTFC
jgi:hypothetical protein